MFYYITKNIKRNINNMKKITVIAQTIDGIYNYSEDMKPLLNNRRKPISSWWYLHGELESVVGFDKGIIVSHEHLLKKDISFKENYNKNESQLWVSNPDSVEKVYYLEDGIYDVEVLGIDKPCIGYFWTSFEQYDNVIGEYPIMRGLVCFKDDKEGVEHAEKKYNEKSTWL